MAQFDHPDLGGLGQWTSGGLTMIGDMFNDELKAKVNNVCSELAALQGWGVEALNDNRLPLPKEQGNTGQDDWWGDDLGYIAASGAQDGTHYAYFPAAKRLATRIGHQVTIYDTAEHQIGGVSQRHAADYSLTFVSQLGPVSLDKLKVVKTHLLPD